MIMSLPPALSRLSVVASFACALMATPVAAQQLYSHGDPTAEEQYSLELINQARRDPTAEGIRLMDTDDPRVQGAYSYFNINRAATKAAFATYPAQPPLAFHPALIAAARAHTADMVANNFQGHNGTDGSTLTTRYQRVSYQSMGIYGENVAAYSESMWFAHCGLNVDWGAQNQIDLGHRRNIMNFDMDTYTEIGIGVTQTNGSVMQGTVGPYVVTQDFGTRNVKYITGVVYSDKNSNGFYDIGEGLAGVDVRPQQGGQYYAVSSTSGGYAIPYSGSGSVTVIASGGPLTSPIPLTVLVGATNVKVDFVPTAEGPGEVALVYPSDGSDGLRSLEVAFEWNAADRAAEYTFELSRAATFDSNSLLTSVKVTEPRFTYTVPQCATKYYWRVRALNTNGTSEWSSVFSFAVNVPAPDAPTSVSPQEKLYVDEKQPIVLRWDAASDAIAYHVRVSRNAGGTDIIAQDTTTELSMELPLSDDLVQRPWYWVVRSIGVCNAGEWTPLASVSVVVTHVEEDGAVAAAGVMPHPATAASRLTVSSATATTLTISIHAVDGAQVVRRTVAVQAGTVAIAGLFENVPPGLYAVRVVGSQHPLHIAVIVE